LFEEEENKEAKQTRSGSNNIIQPPGGGSLSALEPDPARHARGNGKHNKVCCCLCKLLVPTLARSTRFPIPMRLYRTGGRTDSSSAVATALSN